MTEPKILQSNTHFFDVLVGYFRASGFYRLYKSMENVEKIRILVGLNVDKQTVDIIDRAKQEYITEKQSKEAFAKNVEDEFADTEDTAEVESGVRTFVKWLKEGKMEMRMYHERPIHAKVYIMRKGVGGDELGKVITGSSNFSFAGLQNNLEFNVELRDDADVQFALDKFEELWAKGTEITRDYVAAVEQRTWLREDITPYQLFLKTLYEYFQEEINSDKLQLENSFLPANNIKLKYQDDAVIQAKKILDAYNGVFIADVVGLGKTFICAKLAQKLNDGRILVICPPVLCDYWNRVLEDYNVPKTVISLGKLDQLKQNDIERYKYIFVDEAHRFRNQDTESYKLLHSICYDKKVVLISATPMNNYSADIANQIYLFQDRHDCTISDVQDVEDFFGKLMLKTKKFEKGTPEYIAQIRENSKEIRDRLLRHIMIRRTRKEIEKYYAKDLETQGLKFPKLGTPEHIVYEFDDKLDNIFNETMGIIQNFKYSRYKPLTYLIDPSAEYRKAMAAQQNMAGFMRGILVKRLESSFYAFKLTLGRFVTSYKKFIKMYESGDVYISKQVDVYDLMDRDLDKLLQAVEDDKVVHFTSDEFNDEFFNDLQFDLNELEKMQALWADVDADPKLDKFKFELLNNKKFKGNKKIIFTESKETAIYLEENLKSIFADRVVSYSGESSKPLKQIIEDSFDPAKYDKGYPEKDKYDVLITTDVLAEGVNLHRANVLLNYDLPWNPTRIMQRVGRINRVGSPYEEIFVFNFFPTAQSSQHISLTDRIEEKLQMFHSTLGDDFKYLTDREVVEGQKLFDIVQVDFNDDEGDGNPELEYLQIIRDVRDNDEHLFESIKRLPKKVRSGRINKFSDQPSTLTFFRKGSFKRFYKTENGLTKQIDFIEAIKLLQCETDEPKQALAETYYAQGAMNSSAFDSEIEVKNLNVVTKSATSMNDKRIITIIKALKNAPFMTDNDLEVLDNMLTAYMDGRIPGNVSKAIIKKIKGIEEPGTFYAVLKQNIDEKYFEKRKTRKRVEGKKQTILSCYFGGK